MIRSIMVAGLGFEPRQTDSESAVLPLHHPAFENRDDTIRAPEIKGSIAFRNMALRLLGWPHIPGVLLARGQLDFVWG